MWPGGNPTATEGIVKYLHSKFKDDIRVIVPQMSMSAGTMLACSAKTITIVRFYYTGAVAHAIAIDFSETNN